MNVLINGASGYIGYHLTNELLSCGHKVYAVCRNSEGYLNNITKNDKLIIIKTSQEELEDKISDIHIDVWYHLIWDGSLGEKRTDPILQLSNVAMCVNALKTAERIGCKKIIFTGTVYENFADSIVSDPEKNKHAFYIISKKQAHELTLQMSKDMKIKYIWVQFCHPAGKYMNKNQLIPYAVNAFVNDDETAFGKCDNYFDIFAVEYLAEALRELGEKNTSKSMYYIGSGASKKLHEYIEKAAEICDYSLSIGFGKKPDDKLIFNNDWFDTIDLERDTGLKYTYSFENIVQNIKDSLSYDQ